MNLGLKFLLAHTTKSGYNAVHGPVVGRHLDILSEGPSKRDGTESRMKVSLENQ